MLPLEQEEFRRQIDSMISPTRFKLRMLTNETFEECTTSFCKIVLLGKVAHILSIRRYKTKEIVEKIAIEKYQKNGLGITIEDIERNFSINKTKAQRNLKYFHERDILFTANDLILEGITVLKNTSPQQYFPTYIKSKSSDTL